jgi:2-polyprenyl-3-methyl-5-hydroxy-6-metoxy-1,4-benzoquinol methylase
MDRFFDSKSRALPPVAVGRMLEIGCASGSFLQTMSQAGWAVEGVEFSATAGAAARALGFPVQVSALEDATAPRAPVDLVVGWMVLEHLHHPVECLLKLKEWTRPGGWLVVSVPDAGSSEAKLFSRNWYDLHLPAHLQHFTASSLTRMLDMSGWKVDRLVHQRMLSPAIMSAALWAEENGHERTSRALKAVTTLSRLSLLLYPLASLASLAAASGRMTVWARRSD